MYLLSLLSLMVFCRLVDSLTTRLDFEVHINGLHVNQSKQHDHLCFWFLVLQICRKSTNQVSLGKPKSADIDVVKYQVEDSLHNKINWDGCIRNRSFAMQKKGLRLSKISLNSDDLQLDDISSNTGVPKVATCIPYESSTSDRIDLMGTFWSDLD